MNWVGYGFGFSHFYCFGKTCLGFISNGLFFLSDFGSFEWVSLREIEDAKRGNFFILFLFVLGS